MLRLVALLALLVSTAHADDWMSPTTQTVVSPNKKLDAVITPAANHKGPTASVGEKGRKHWTYALKNVEMPVEVVLFDDGSLLALDDWGTLGVGTVATMYERDGAVRWTKTLADLLGQTFVDGAPRSVSSIWWRTTPIEWTLAKDGKSGVITLYDENQLQLVLRDGSATPVAVATLPDQPQRLLNRARALASKGQDAAAAALLERVIDKNPDLLEAVMVYVHALQHANEHARAVTTLEHISTRWKPGGPDDYNIANVYVAWAESLNALARPKDAERMLRLAVKAAPSYLNPTEALSTLLVDQHRPVDADVVLDDFLARLLKAPSLDTYALMGVADIYKVRGELAKALAYYLKAYKPGEVTNQFLYESLAKLYEQLGKDADAIRVDEQLLAYFTKLGSPFAMYITSTTNELARLRAKKKQPTH